MTNDPSSSLLPISDPFNLEEIVNPVGAEDDVIERNEEEKTPEPLTNTEMEELMKKVELLGSKGDIEFAEMIRRLVMTSPTSSQVQAQAEEISNLCYQRDYLLERQGDERQLWQMERDEWGRTSEILLARANIEGGRSRELQLEHRNNSVLSENTTLKNKLNYSAERIAYLETEISQLKPLLLMQPLSIIQSYSHSSVSAPTSKPKPKVLSSATAPVGLGTNSIANTEKEPEPGHTRPIDTSIPAGDNASQQIVNENVTGAGPSEPKTPATNNVNLPPVTPTPSKPKGDYYRGSVPASIPPSNYISLSFSGSQNPPITPIPSKTPGPAFVPTSVPPPTPSKTNPDASPTKSKQKLKSKPSSADAKTEHLILAARKLGRERTTFLSGMYIPPATYYAYPGGYHPLMGMGMYQYHQPANPNHASQNAGVAPTPAPPPHIYSPFFAHGNTAYAYASAYPGTPPPKGRGSVQHGQSMIGSTTRKGMANYYPNVMIDKRTSFDGQIQHQSGSNKDLQPVASASSVMGRSPGKVPSTPRMKRKAGVMSSSRSGASAPDIGKIPGSNKAGTPSALDNLLSAAQTVLSSPTTPSARAGARRKRRRLLPPADLEGGEDGEAAAEDGQAGGGGDTEEAEEDDITPTLTESTFAARRRSRRERESTPTPVGTNGNGSRSGLGSGSRFSALDVLANQATIFHSQESGQSSSSGAEGAGAEERDPEAESEEGEEEDVMEMVLDCGEAEDGRMGKGKTRDKGKERGASSNSSNEGTGEGGNDVTGLGTEPERLKTSTKEGGEETDADADGEADVEHDGQTGIAQPLQENNGFSRSNKRSPDRPSQTPSASKLQLPNTSATLAPPISLASAPTMPFIPMHPNAFTFAPHPPSGGVIPAATSHYTVFYGNKPFSIPFPASSITPSGSVSTHSVNSKLASSQSLPPSFGGSVATTLPIGGKSFIHHEPATGKRTRSPYTKWTPEEDVLLEQAVLKYGQKWDLVQKELPNRGYHQVRQRWLRKQHTKDGMKIMNDG